VSQKWWNLSPKLGEVALDIDSRFWGIEATGKSTLFWCLGGVTILTLQLKMVVSLTSGRYQAVTTRIGDCLLTNKAF